MARPLGGIRSAEVAVLKVRDLGYQVWRDFVRSLGSKGPGTPGMSRPVGGSGGRDVGCDTWNDWSSGLDPWLNNACLSRSTVAMDWAVGRGRGRHEDPHCGVPLVSGVRVRGGRALEREDGPLWWGQSVGEELGQHKAEQGESEPTADQGPQHGGDAVQRRGGLWMAANLP